MANTLQLLMTVLMNKVDNDVVCQLNNDNGEHKATSFKII